MRRVVLLLAVVIMAIIALLIFRFRPKPPVVEQPTLSSEVNVYLDISMSMRGYFKAAPQPGSPIQRFLWDGIVPILKEDFPRTQLKLVRFGTEIEETEPVEDVYRVLRFRDQSSLVSTFDGTDTALIGLLNAIKSDPPLAFVLVTDGIPSGDWAGPNPEMVGSLRALIDGGEYALWLVGVKSDFDGLVYPESPDPYGNRTPFSYSGLRPILILVGAREKQQGLNAVASTINKLTDLTGDPERVKIAEVSFVDVGGGQLKVAELENDDRVLVQMDDERTRIRFAPNLTESVDVPLDITWEPEVLVKPKEVLIDTGAKNLLGVSVRREESQWNLRLAPGESVGSQFVVYLRVVFDMKEWWREWSTDDDSSRDSADKLLYLGSLVDKLTRNTPDTYLLDSLQVTVE